MGRHSSTCQRKQHCAILLALRISCNSESGAMQWQGSAAQHMSIIIHTNPTKEADLLREGLRPQRRPPLLHRYLCARYTGAGALGMDFSFLPCQLSAPRGVVPGMASSSLGCAAPNTSLCPGLCAGKPEGAHVCSAAPACVSLAVK